MHIRHYGWLANACRRTRLPPVREAITRYAPSLPTVADKPLEAIARFDGIPCPCCKTGMMWVRYPLPAVAPAAQKARNTQNPVLCLTTIRVANGETVMEKQRLMGNNRATWAGGARGRKSNPLIDKLLDSVARGFVQPNIYAQCCRTRHKIL